MVIFEDVADIDEDDFGFGFGFEPVVVEGFGDDFGCFSRFFEIELDGDSEE